MTAPTYRCADFDVDKSGQQAEPPYFSNGTEWEIWSYNYCDRCYHDRRARDGVYEEGCPLIVKSMNREPIPLWVYQQRGTWQCTQCVDGHEHPWWDIHCLRFSPEDGYGGGLPVPKPTPPGQSQLFDAGEFDWDRPRSVPVEVSV